MILKKFQTKNTLNLIWFNKNHSIYSINFINEKILVKINIINATKF